MATSPQTTAFIACPFVAGPMITTPSLFIGRKEILHSMTMLMTGPQPTSINIVGERRIGKSSLLYHFFQTWEQRVAQSNRYVVIYLSLQDAKCHSKQSFYRAVAKEFLRRPTVQARTDLAKGLNTPNISASSFADICDRWKQAQVLPVLCLDEFETWLEDQQEFDDHFFDHLRSLMNNNTLMLIISSQRPLDEYGTQNKLTSAFFNVGHVRNLREFSNDEVAELLCLPATSVTPNIKAVLSLDEQHIAHKWGGHHPYLLQMAAKLLCEARQQGKDKHWAKAQFEKEKKRLPNAFWWQSRWLKPLYWLFWKFPQLLGKWSKWLGGSVDDLKAWARGMVVIVLAVLVVSLVLVHIVTPAQVGKWFLQVYKTLLGG